MMKLNIFLLAGTALMILTSSTPAIAHGDHIFENAREKAQHMRTHDGQKMPNTDFDEDDLEDDRDYDVQSMKKRLKEMRTEEGRPLPNTGFDEDVIRKHDD